MRHDATGVSRVLGGCKADGMWARAGLPSNEEATMTRVLILADDDCIRFTCAEVLTRLGFEASSSAASGLSGAMPDAILLWETAAGSLRAIRAAYPGVPVILCTWDHRREWPGADAVVQLPFNGDRVSLTLHKMARANRASARDASTV